MNFFRLFKKEDQVKNPNGSESLEKILGHFTDLVKENNETLEWITDLEEKQGGHFLFDMSYLRSTADRITERVGSIVDHLIHIAPNRYEELKEIYTRIRNQVEKSLGEKNEELPARHLRSTEKIDPGKLLRAGFLESSHPPGRRDGRGFRDRGRSCLDSPVQ